MKAREAWEPLRGPDLIRWVAKIIRDHPQAHEQAVWTRGMSGSPASEVLIELLEGHSPCGTTACVAGWAALASAPEGAVIYGETHIIFRRGQNRHFIRDVAREAMGLSPDTAEWLFRSVRTRDEILAALEYLADDPGANLYRAVSAVEGALA